AKLLNYSEKIFEQFEERFRIALKNPGQEEAIHDLRTSTKRIKAFLKLVDHLNKDFKYAANYSPWKKLFKEVGRYRSCQVMTALAAEWIEKTGGQLANTQGCIPPD